MGDQHIGGPRASKVVGVTVPPSLFGGFANEDLGLELGVTVRKKN